MTLSPVPPPSDIRPRVSSSSSTITRETWVPLGVAGTVFVAIIGAMVWIVSGSTRMEVQAQHLDSRVSEVESSVKELQVVNGGRDVVLVGIQRDVLEVRDALRRIEQGMEGTRTARGAR